MSPRISRRTGATALLAMGGLLGALLIAVPAAPAATIHACQKKKGGTIRIVSSKTKCKKSSEKKIRWSTTGPAGKNGANGTNGTSGANGTNGTSGANGTNGTTGATGGRGPSNAYFGAADVIALDNTNKVLVTVNLPAGLYLVFAGATIERAGVGGQTDCHIRQDGVSINSDLYNVLESAPSPNAHVGNVQGMVSVNLAAPATMTLTCRDTQTTALTGGSYLAAIQVGALN